MFHIISLGAGVQSSTMGLMAGKGLIDPMPDCAIFADTLSEPSAVYEWLDWLESELPFPVYRVSAGNLAASIAVKQGEFRRVDIPAFVQINGRASGLINRSCTRDYKLRPIQKKMREIAGLVRKHAPKSPIISNWMGISTDEATRMKPSREGWIENRWPLIEQRMNRTDCLRWMEANGYPQPPKSSCIFCPYHSDHQWQLLNDAEAKSAIRIDESLRAHPASEYRQDGTLFLHRSGRPLSEVLQDLAFVRDFGALNGQINLFENECSGICST